MSHPSLHRAAAVTGVGVLTLVSFMAPASAAAADGDVEVVNTETVQAYTDATGEVTSTRLYEQLHLTGTGTAALENPAVLDGLRNLDGFGGFETADGEQYVEVDVDGSEDLRTVSDYDEDLPLEIEVDYALDGEPVEPGDLVGATGELEVLYTITNVTGRVQTVSFPDASGQTVTEDVEVAIPMVGSLSTILPSSFREVASGQANMAGDGRGNTKLSFTMTLVPPVGADTVSFGYTAQVDDAVLPRASVTALPVNPMESPTFKSAGDSYAAGAATGSELTDGASQIDANLLLLRDGASELLAGLIQLRDGASQLKEGLAGDAAPGSQKLADGAGKLADGLQDDAAPGSQKLADGTGKLAGGTTELTDGTARLTDGTGLLADGGVSLAQGLASISGGLDQLADVEGLPAAQDGIRQLQDGVTALSAGLGDVSNPNSLIGGLAQLDGGLGQLSSGSGRIVGGLEQLAGGLPQAKGGVDQVKQGLDAATGQGGSLDRLIGGLGSLLQLPECRDSQVCAGTVDQLLAGAKQSKSDLGSASAGLAQVSAGLATAIQGVTGQGQLLDGARQLQAGLADAHAGAGKLRTGAVDAKAGVAKISGGLDALSVGVTGAVGGVLQLADGASEAYGGSVRLAGGLTTLDGKAAELDAGAQKLDAGAQELDAGAAKLAEGLLAAASGSGELVDGAEKLADGLQDAADGSGRLSDGLDEAAGGAPKLVDGAQELSDRGTSKLIEAGEGVAAEYGVMYAQLEAGAERAEDEGMIVGAPEDAIGLAAYTFEIEGEDGAGSRNLARGLAALGLLGAAAGSILLRRRLG